MRTCTVTNCTGHYYAKGFCHRHYNAYLRGYTQLASRQCIIPGCLQTTYSKDRPFCHEHNKRWLKSLGLLHKNNSNGGEYNGNWNGGVFPYLHSGLWRRSRKKKLIAANYVCERCGEQATRVHHVDFKKENHLLENLMSLCARCHYDIHIEYNHKVKPCCKVVDCIEKTFAKNLCRRHYHILAMRRWRANHKGNKNV